MVQCVTWCTDPLQLNEAGEDWVDAVDDIMEQFMRETGRTVVFTVCFT